MNMSIQKNLRIFENIEGHIKEMETGPGRVQLYTGNP